MLLESQTHASSTSKKWHARLLSCFKSNNAQCTPSAPPVAAAQSGCAADGIILEAPAASTTPTSSPVSRKAAIDHVRNQDIISQLKPPLEAAMTSPTCSTAGASTNPASTSSILALTGPVRSWLDSARVLPYYVLRLLLHLGGNHADAQAFMVLQAAAAAAMSQPQLASLDLAQFKDKATAAAASTRTHGLPADLYSSYDAEAGVAEFMAAVKTLARIPSGKRKTVTERFGRNLARQPLLTELDMQQYAEVLPAVLAVEQDDILVSLLRSGKEQMSPDGVQLQRQAAAAAAAAAAQHNHQQPVL